MSEAAPASAPREALSLIHHHPGRLRVRAEAFRAGQSGSAADRVRTALEVEPGIIAVSHKARTGSLLVEYQPGLADPEAILVRIASAAGLDPPTDDALTRPREPALVAIDAARELNDIVHEISGFQTDLRSLVPAGMAALAAYSFVASKHERMPRWDNLMYWSYAIFSQLHGREIAASGRPPSVVAPPEPGAVSGERPQPGDKQRP